MRTKKKLEQLAQSQKKNSPSVKKVLQIPLATLPNPKRVEFD